MISHVCQDSHRYCQRTCADPYLHPLARALWISCRPLRRQCVRYFDIGVGVQRPSKEPLGSLGVLQTPCLGVLHTGQHPDDAAQTRNKGKTAMFSLLFRAPKNRPLDQRIVPAARRLVSINQPLQGRRARVCTRLIGHQDHGVKVWRYETSRRSGLYMLSYTDTLEAAHH